MRRALIALALLASGCGNFEDQSIVLDMRPLGMRADPPEVVSPVDPKDPTNLQLVEVQVCALVADPAADRTLSYSMGICAPTGSGRCDDPAGPYYEIAFGTVDDPETADPPPQICGTIPAGGQLLPILQRSLDTDQLSGFGGINVQVELNVYGEDEAPKDARFASKIVLYSPQIPMERVANNNPTLDRIEAVPVDADTGDPTGDAFDLPFGRCADITPVELPIDSHLKLTPIEPDGAREDYVLPTFDGGSEMFTENLRYAWFATAGAWTRGESGGPRDLAGNEPPLDSTFKAEIDSTDVGDGLDVPLWIVQRDERGGQAWFESCVHVTP